MSNKNNDKAHLLYMTGLSIDKNRMNNITENINFDKDFSYWRDDTKREFDNIKSIWNQLLSKCEKITYSVTKSQTNALIGVAVTGGINLFNGLIENISKKLSEAVLTETILTKTIDSEINDFSTSYIDNKVLKPVVSTVFKQIGYKNEDSIYSNESKKIFDLFKKYCETIPNYKNGDFFSLYLSNQSDSLGLVPLAKLSATSDFNLHHSYCDLDFFDNKYVDHVILKVDLTGKDGTKDNIKKMIADVFKVHVREIMFSKAIAEKTNTVTDEKDNKTYSLLDLMLNDNKRYNTNDILKTLSERNFFGISLLSQILYVLNRELEISSNVEFDEPNGSTEYHFLKELLAMASSPEDTGSNARKKITAKIYFSDGKTLNKAKKDLTNGLSDYLADDKYFKKTIKLNNDISNLSTLHQEEEDIKKIGEYIKTCSIHTISTSSSTDQFEYIYLDTKEMYIKVPIKMMLSLPVDKDSKPNSDIYLPDCLIDNDKNVIDVLTVGGAEHNRALAHLINKHRLEYKENRLFGFMDNHFDMEHKVTRLDDSQTHDNSYNFFMGLNQPVSGWNYLLNARQNDNDGNSVNSDVKFLTFKLRDNDRNQKINIVSIYGFSAIASVLGINMFIAELSQRESLKAGLFSGEFSKLFDDFKIEPSEQTLYFDG